MDIRNKTIMITGATGGIGQAIAEQLANLGAHLLLIGRNMTLLEMQFEKLSSLYPNQMFKFLAKDLTQADVISSLECVAKDLSQNGHPIDIVINCAGVNHFQFFAQRSTTSIKQEVDINLIAPMLITQSAIAWINKPGIILNIGSTLGAIGYPGYTTYGATKAGLHRFCEALTRELEGSGVKILYLAPRATQTSINTQSINELNHILGNKSDPVEVVAKAVITSLKKETATRYLGWPERLFVKINQLFPNIVSHSILKQQEKIHLYINKNNHDQI